MNNIYDDPSYSQVQQMLHERLEELRVQYKDSDSLNAQWIAHDLQRLKEIE